MSYCENCRFRLPEDASFCPNCGAPVKRKVGFSVSPMKSVVKSLQMGLLGAFLSAIILSFQPEGINLYFIPSFVASLIVIFLSRTRKFDDALIIAMSVYLFADAIMGGLILGSLYATNTSLAELYGNSVPTLLDVIMYVAHPITAFIAGYIGIRLTSKTRGKEPSPITYSGGKEEGPGGIVYGL